MLTANDLLYHFRRASKITVLKVGNVVEAISQLLVLAGIEVDFGIAGGGVLGIAGGGVLAQWIDTTDVMVKLLLYNEGV